MEKIFNVLIVDDLELVHKPIEDFLKNFVFMENNFTTTSAYNLTQAKRILLGNTFDLVMLDGEAGNGWGYEIISDILKNNNEVMIITSSNYDAFNVKNIEMGCHESVNKTFLYEWNDEKSDYRTQKGQVIMGLIKAKLHKR